MRRTNWLILSSSACALAMSALTSLGCSAKTTSGPSSGGTSDKTPGTMMPAGGATSAGGATGATKGCGQGTSCTAADDLAAPAADLGFHIETPANKIVVQPGQEAFLCFYKNIPVSSAVNIGTMQSWMTPGSSHHFIAFQTGGTGGGGGFGGIPGFGGPQPDGTLSSCGLGAGGQWVFATSVPGKEIELKMPDGVGLPFSASTQIMLNMHFINPGADTAYPQVKMNFLYAQNLQYQAAPMISFNTSINVPAAAADGTPGTQTVSGTCSAPAGAQFFLMTSHTHKHATLTQVNYISGGQTTNIVNTTDWENPDVGLWNSPNFLTVQQGDSFTYSCTYENTAASAVTVGETAAYNEMCMAIGYYFPATVGAAGCR